MPEPAFLGPGSSIDVGHARLITCDLRWSAGTQTAFAERIGVAAFPLVRGRLASREHVVFSGQPATPEGAVRLSDVSGVLEVELGTLPRDVERLAVLAYVHPRPNTSRRTLDELDALTITVLDGDSDRVLGRSVNETAFVGPVMAATLAEIIRDGDGWTVVVQARGHESGLEGAAAQAGLRL